MAEENKFKNQQHLLALLFASCFCLAAVLELCGLPILPSEAIAAICAGAIAVSVRKKRLQKLQSIQGQLQSAVDRAAGLEKIAEIQRKLDDNLDYLRRLVEAHGEPNIQDGALYFGNVKVGEDDSIVDRVRAEYGGGATIFPATFVFLRISKGLTVAA